MNKKIDIVIISYAKDDYCREITKDCLSSLLLSEEKAEEIFNIIVVESQPDVKWEHLSNSITTYPAPTPYGYHKFLNFGRKMGNSEWVALCNNDLCFTKSWFTRILKAHEDNPDFISFSPICPMTQITYGIKPHTGNLPGYEIRKHISGWCIVHKREIYNTIGDLDERFYHWFCDNDYSMELQHKGIKHMLVTDSIVIHHDKNIGKTTEVVVKDPSEMFRLTNGSLPIFKEKWKTLLKI